MGLDDLTSYKKFTPSSLSAIILSGAFGSVYIIEQNAFA